MTNTTTNRMKRLIADISEHGATPSRVKKITNALRAVTAERDRLREALESQSDPWRSVVAYMLQDDLNNRLTTRVVDVAYTAFMNAHEENGDDGGPTDWFTDTRPIVMECITKMRKEADKEIRAFLAEKESHNA